MEDFIIRYFNRDISVEELDILLTWLKDDKANRDQFFELKNIYESNAHKVSDKTLDECWSKIYLDINRVCDNASYESKYKILRNRIIKFSYAASILILISATSLYFVDAKNLDEEAIISYNEISVSKGETMTKLTLSDGTFVELKSNSTLKYPNNFSDQKRDVYLDGEAFFDVAKSDDKKFVVHTSSQKIEVLGTYFRVRDHKSEAYSNVTLISGKINLEVDNKDYSLIPNQTVFVDKINKETELRDIPSDLNQVFVSKRYHFKEKSLSQILDDVEILYGVDIELKNELLGDIYYTGTFSLNQTINEIMTVINYKNQFDYTIVNNHEIKIHSREKS